MKSDINPFDSQEAKPYKNDPEILAMTNLVVSYQNNDINEFESILRNNRNNIMADPFIKEHIEGRHWWLPTKQNILILFVIEMLFKLFRTRNLLFKWPSLVTQLYNFLRLTLS